MSIQIEIPPGLQPKTLERLLTSGETGVEKRFFAVGAADAYYETANARYGLPTTKKDPYDLRVARVATDAAARQVLDFAWDDSAGETSMLSAYGDHLVHLRAVTSDALDAPLVRPSATQGFVEVDRRLAQRDGEGLRFQTIRADEAASVAQSAMSAAEQSAWSALANGCACPVCATLLWTAEEADTLAAAIESRTPGAIIDVTRYVTVTPRLMKAIVLAGARWRTLLDPGQVGRFWTFWRKSRIRDAQAFAEPLIASEDTDVRANALAITIMGLDEPLAADRVRAALLDAPEVALAAIEAWLHRPGFLHGSIAMLNERLVELVAPSFVDALEKTQHAELAFMIIHSISSYPRVVPKDEWTRFKKALTPWAKHPRTENVAKYAKTQRAPK